MIIHDLLPILYLFTPFNLYIVLIAEKRRKNHGRAQGTEHWSCVSPRPQKNENEALFMEQLVSNSDMCFSPSDYIFINVSLTVSPFS